MTIDKAFIKLFDSEVKKAYQAHRTLAGTVRERKGVVGSSVQFPRIGTGVATKRQDRRNVIPLNVDYSHVTVPLESWAVADYSGIFHQRRVNFDQRTELSMGVLAPAIGRRMDQLIVDALKALPTVASTGSPDHQKNLIANRNAFSVGHGTGGTNRTMAIEFFQAAKKAMDQQNVPDDDRYMLIGASQLHALLSTTKATSVDFVPMRSLVTGEIDRLYGMKVITWGDRPEGGLSKTTAATDYSGVTSPVSPAIDDRICWCWHKSAIAYAENMSRSVMVDYIPEKTSYLVLQAFQAGAGVIDASGVVKMFVDE